jgi:hypothetical protein
MNPSVAGLGSGPALSAQPERGAGSATVVAGDPRVFGESRYDRVTSMLMSVVVGASIVVGWLYLIYLTNQEYNRRVTSPLQIIEVFGGGGGSPEGTAGSTEKVDVSGADASALASNNEESAADFEEPSVRQTPAAMLDAVAEAGQNLAEVDLGAVMPNGTLVASGKRSSRIGTGGPGLGFGPGDGGVPAEQRWSIVYNPGQTIEEYARQLDSLGVELAVVSGPNQLTFVSRFSDAAPSKRYGTGQGDDRLYFLWQGRGRKASDVALLHKAGIEVGEGVVMQFYPKAVEVQLAQLEVRYRNRQPLEIRFTRFSVVPRGNGYGFMVLAQEPLR